MYNKIIKSLERHINILYFIIFYNNLKYVYLIKIFASFYFDIILCLPRNHSTTDRNASIRAQNKDLLN